MGNCKKRLLLHAPSHSIETSGIVKEAASEDRLLEIASRFSELNHVEAVALAGSTATGTWDEKSDYDLYVYSHEFVDLDFRKTQAPPRARIVELHRTFWEDEDSWIEADMKQIQIMYRTISWTESELTRRLDRYEASLGYTTAICYNIKQSRALWDRSAWFAGIQVRLLEGYPDELARAIVRKNLPVMGRIISSYEHQIESAFLRQDLVCLNHRVAAWIASYFDILFAANRSYHPGEKRLLTHAQNLPSVPESMVDDLRTACSHAANLERSIADHLANVRYRLEDWLKGMSLI
jgi:predicted nucleotidyltransferase